MSSARVHFHQAGRTSASAGEPSREVQELWFTLARRPWSSLVLVPADEGFSVATLASQLADVGGRLRDTPVTAVIADAIDSESARMLADLQLRVQEDHSGPSRTDVVESHIVVPQLGTGSREADGTPANGGGRETLPVGPAAQLVVAIQPVVVEPLGVAIAQAADTVILCVELGKTRLESARRTVELIGPDRVIGAFLIR
jgi:hypothetical protein